MKKLICLLLCLCLVGCSSTKSKTNNKKENKVIEENEIIEENEDTDEEDQKKQEEISDTDNKIDEEKKDEEVSETKQDSTNTQAVTDSTVTDSSTTSEQTSTPSQTTTEPVVTSNSGVALMNKSRIVVIDAGHGGVDSGCYNGGYLEKDITLNYALTLGSILQNSGVQVVYIRTGDTNLAMDSYRLSDGTVKTNDLRARAELGESYNAALYISLHIDSADGTATGYSVYVHSGHADSVDLGNQINAQLAAVGYTNSRGVMDGSSLRVIRCNTTISCLIELGFITGDLSKLIDASYQQRICQAIANGVITKLNNGWIEPSLVLVKQPDLY